MKYLYGFLAICCLLVLSGCLSSEITMENVIEDNELIQGVGDVNNSSNYDEKGMVLERFSDQDEDIQTNRNLLLRYYYNEFGSTSFFFSGLLDVLSLNDLGFQSTDILNFTKRDVLLVTMSFVDFLGKQGVIKLYIHDGDVIGYVINVGQSESAVLLDNNTISYSFDGGSSFSSNKVNSDAFNNTSVSDVDGFKRFILSNSIFKKIKSDSIKLISQETQIQYAFDLGNFETSNSAIYLGDWNQSSYSNMSVSDPMRSPESKVSNILETLNFVQTINYELDDPYPSTLARIFADSAVYYNNLSDGKLCDSSDLLKSYFKVNEDLYYMIVPLGSGNFPGKDNTRSYENNMNFFLGNPDIFFKDSDCKNLDLNKIQQYKELSCKFDDITLCPKGSQYVAIVCPECNNFSENSVKFKSNVIFVK